MVLVQNKYKNTLVGVLRTQITFVTHSSPSCYVTLRTQVIRLNSGNLGLQTTDSGVFINVNITSCRDMYITILQNRSLLKHMGQGRHRENCCTHSFCWHHCRENIRFCDPDVTVSVTPARHLTASLSKLDILCSIYNFVWCV